MLYGRPVRASTLIRYAHRPWDVLPVPQEGVMLENCVGIVSTIAITVQPLDPPCKAGLRGEWYE